MSPSLTILPNNRQQPATVEPLNITLFCCRALSFVVGSGINLSHQIRATPPRKKHTVIWECPPTQFPTPEEKSDKFIVLSSLFILFFLVSKSQAMSKTLP